MKTKVFMVILCIIFSAYILVACGAEKNNTDMAHEESVGVEKSVEADKIIGQEQAEYDEEKKEVVPEDNMNVDIKPRGTVNEQGVFELEGKYIQTDVPLAEAFFYVGENEKVAREDIERILDFDFYYQEDISGYSTWEMYEIDEELATGFICMEIDFDHLEESYMWAVLVECFNTMNYKEVSACSDTIWENGWRSEDYIKHWACSAICYKISQYIEEKVPNIEEEVPTEYYTIDNLPDGYFIKQGEKFYPLDTELPEEVSIENVGTYYTVAAADYSDDLFPTYQQDTVFVLKGDYSKIPSIREIEYYGFTYNACFSVGYYPNKIEAIVGDCSYENIYYINDCEQSIYDYAKNNGWVSVPRGTADDIYLNNFTPEDSIKIGYYEGTEYQEATLYADLWYAYATSASMWDTEIWEKDLDVNRTKEGYFELTIPTVPQPGLYKMDFGEPYTWKEDKFLVWIE